MAKKTLSMSLVVAMLATSNVPVWATEFSDGTDISTFSSEAQAPVVDNGVTDDTASAQTIVDDSSAATKPSVSIVAASDVATVGETLRVESNRFNKDLNKNTDYKNQDFVAYGWYSVDNDGTEKNISGVNQDNANHPLINDEYTVTKDDIGKKIICKMHIHRKATGEDSDKWDDSVAISAAIPVAYSLDAEDYYDSTIKADEYVKQGDQLSYTGNVSLKKEDASISELKWYDPSGNEVTKKSENFLRATELGEYTLKATVTAPNFSKTVTLATVTSVKNINAESITGTVSISNEANNQWGYENTAEYHAEVPTGVELNYIWQTYNEEDKKWEKPAGKNVEGKDKKIVPEKFIPDKEDCGKKLRVVAQFINAESKQVIKEVESNNYEVAPLQIAADDITYGNDLNFYIKEVENPAKVDWVKVFKKDVYGTKENPKPVEKDEYELITQDTDKSGIRTVTIKLKGAYSGEKTVTVNVGEFSLKTCKVTLENKYVPFVGDGQYAAPVIKEVEWANRVSLKEGEDYVVDKTSLKNGITLDGKKYDCINAGPQYIRLLGRGDFTGSDLDVPYEIVARSMENCKVVWTGKPVVKGEPLVAGTDVKDSKNTHFVVVDNKGYVLVPDKDYTYDKEGIYDVSQQKCKVKITAKGAKEDKVNKVYTGANYYGTTESDYTTVGTNLEAALTAYVQEVVSAQDYTGKAITFSKLNKISANEVKAANRKAGTGIEDVGFTDDLEVGVDFDITYLNNTNAYLLKDKNGKYIDYKNGERVDAHSAFDTNGVKYYTVSDNSVDFDVANDDPQAPQVYITFKGKFSGQTTPVRFSIRQAKFDLSEANKLALKGGVTFDPTATDASAMTTYADQLKAIKVIFDKTQELKNTVDYTYDYYYVNDTQDVSTEDGVFKYEAVAHNSRVLEGSTRVSVYDGNFYGSFSEQVPVDAKSITAKSITVDDIANQKYSGKLIEPKVTVKDGSYTLVEGTDYQLSYKNNRSAGTATVTINGLTAKGRYTDSISKTFTIENKSIADAKIMKKGSYNSSYTDLSKYKASDYVLKSSLYNNGREVSADFDVVDANNNLLREGYDYTVEYKNNTKVGTATIVITGKGDYEGTLEGSFEILGKGISGHFVEEKIPAQTYTGSAVEPKVTFVPDSPNLVEGKDYEITYEYNVNPGKGDATDINNVGPKVVAHGIGQYAGYVKLGFEIKKADITVANVKAEDATYAGGKIAESKITVTNPAGGAALKEGEDYTVEYVSGTNVGDTGKAILHLVNNKCYTFSGDDSNNATIIVTYNIVAKDLKDVTVDTIEDQTATGAQIKPGLVVKNGNVLMKEGVDYQVTYGTNTEIGAGTVTLTPVEGNKNYTGSKEVTFKIVEAKLEVGAPMISDVKVVGNRATVILSGEAEGAAGYDYVISTDKDCITNKNYVSVNKNQVSTSTPFKYVQKGTYYAYCHAWTRDANGKKVFGEWSEGKKFKVTAITPDAPVITNVKVSGSTIKVTYKAAANATGYDVVLGTSSKKENGETRPYHYGDHKVLNLKEGTVTATFKNVPAGTWTVGMHAFNRTSENNRKVFSPWSNLKKATVK